MEQRILHEGIPDPYSLRLRFFLILLGTLVYVITFTSMFRFIGYAMFILIYIFPIAAGWFLGMKGGLFFGFFISIVTIFQGSLVGATTRDSIPIIIMTSITLILFGMGLGRSRDLTVRVMRELKKRKKVEEELRLSQSDLEMSVRARTEELERANRELKNEINVRWDIETALREKKEELEETLRKLRETQAHMIQSEKMASVGQLAAGVAHEINNPTGFVNSNLNILADYHGDIGRILKEYRDLVARLKAVISDKGEIDSLSGNVEGILSMESEIDIEFLQDDIPKLIMESRQGTERIRKIVAALKDFAHPGREGMQPADINACIESTLNVVCNELKYKATVIKEFGELPAVQCNPQQLNQVFMNLLVNAVQAIEKQGEIKILTTRDDGQVVIKISDTGSGIPEQNLNRIFDPFFTTKEVGKGTGLGLHIAYDIIQKHGGRIEVESREGKGTVFTLRIPFVQEN